MTLRLAATVKTFAKLTLASALTTSAFAQVISINLPDLVLQPNTPNQSFNFTVTTDGAINVAGVFFYLQITDGGAPGGAPNGPRITSVDIFTSTPFAAYSDDSGAGAGTDNQSWESSTLLPISDPPVSLTSGSRIARVTFDTTGVAPGNYEYSAYNAGSDNQITYFDEGYNEVPVLGSGLGDTATLTVVPEPASVALFAAAGCLGIGFAVRRFRR